MEPVTTGITLAKLLPYLIMAGGSLAGSLFSKPKTATHATTTPPATPMDPGYGLLSPMLMGILSEGWGRMGGAGMPGGGAPGGDFSADILKYLRESWPDIMSEAQDPRRPGEKRIGDFKEKMWGKLSPKQQDILRAREERKKK